MLSNQPPRVPSSPPTVPSKSVSRSVPMRRMVTNPVLDISEPMERTRSNTETQNFKTAKRLGFVSKRLDSASVGESGNNSKHHSRGFSHDSIPVVSTESVQTVRKIGREKNTAAYFKRLSRMPEVPKTELASTRVIDGARGLLFVFSQIYLSVRQFVTFCSETGGGSTIDRVLYNANIHVGGLVTALEAYETKDDPTNTDDVVLTALTCVTAFRQVVNNLYQNLAELFSTADARYRRVLLLSVFGACVELQNSWAILRPNLPSNPTQTVRRHNAAQPVNTHRLKSSSSASSSASAAAAANLAMPPPTLPTTAGKSPDTNASPSSPIAPASHYASDSQSSHRFGNDEVLYDKISAATSVSISVLALLMDAVAKSVLAENQNGSSNRGAAEAAIPAKLKDLATFSVSASEVARRLKGRLQHIREADTHDRRKFWEDIQAFVKVIISVLALAKTVSIESSEYRFSESVLSGLSALTRSTKELTILLSGSSFGSMTDGNATPGGQTLSTPLAGPATATPISAALGPAAQAVVPSPAVNMSFGGGGMFSPSIVAASKHDAFPQHLAFNPERQVSSKEKDSGK